MSNICLSTLRLALPLACFSLITGGASANSAPASTLSTPLVAPATINADSVGDALRKCVDNKDPVLRLQCYDAYAGSLGIVPPGVLAKQDQAIAQFGLWTLSHKIDQLGQTVVSVRLPMDQPIMVDGVAKVYPELVFSCKRNDTDAYVDLKVPADIGNNADMNFSFDGGRIFVESWQPSSDGEALFAPNPVAFAQQVYASKALSMSFPTRSHSNMTMVFALDHASAALDALARACYKPIGNTSP